MRSVPGSIVVMRLSLDVKLECRYSEFGTGATVVESRHSEGFGTETLRLGIPDQTRPHQMTDVENSDDGQIEIKCYISVKVLYPGLYLYWPT